MNPYVVRFALANIVLTIITGVAAVALELKSGISFGIAVTMASSIFAAEAFAKDHARAPSAEEKRMFAWRALLIAWLISLVLVALVVAIFVPAAEIKVLVRPFQSGVILAFGTGILVVISAVYYVVIRWSFGWYAKVVAERGR